MLRLLYETNVKEGQKKHDDDRLLNSSTRSENESNELLDMFTDSPDVKAEETQVDDSDDDIVASNEEDQNKLKLFYLNHKNKPLRVNCQQVQTIKNVKNEPDQAFSLFSAPAAEERLPG
jgi:uncharacterized membrane protein affecting hemolysin expression